MSDHEKEYHCISGRCYSPVACGGFGYCRERGKPWDYDPEADMRASIAACYEAVKARVAQGGKGWQGWPEWDDIRGRAPDATGDMSSEEFVRKLRDEWHNR